MVIFYSYVSLPEGIIPKNKKGDVLFIDGYGALNSLA